jgi:phenylpropionate dioxygenase-like ring-hydroxylating dioxygenase large terminal subunit
MAFQRAIEVQGFALHPRQVVISTSLEGSRNNIHARTRLAIATTSAVVDSLGAHQEGHDAEDEKIDWFKYWYPAMPLNYLDDDEDMDTKAIPITILDQQLVVWKSSRSTGNHKYSVLADACPHRRAPLSSGKIVQFKNGDTTSSNLACRYHGWEFDSNGSCTKIPMMEMKVETSTSAMALSKAFCAKSYPTLQHDGLLWVYMDPYEANPPSLPAAASGATSSDSHGQKVKEQSSYSLNVFPVSFQSMIENSFDPSHAPFTHETIDPSKKSFMSYSSKNAIPMERYELVRHEKNNGDEAYDRNGFTVEHSPYHVSTTNSASHPALTTRQFIAPYTNIAQLPWFNMTLHFVPSRAGETLVYAGGPANGSRMNVPSKRITKLVPKRIMNIAHEFLHFYFTNLADGIYRFYNQDVQIMQGQDERKRKSNLHSTSSSWHDMYPTTSDRGVQIFQRWMDQYGGRPSFTMPSHSSKEVSPSISSLNHLSAWDRHAKYCPKCKRTIRRLSKLGNATAKVAQWSLAMSVFGSFLQIMFQVVPAVAPSNRLLFMSSTTILLVLSVASKFLSWKSRDLVQKVFVTPTHVPEYQLMDIYSK